MAGKGDTRRWSDLPKELTDLQWEYTFGCKNDDGTVDQEKKAELREKIEELESKVTMRRRCFGSRV